MDDLFAQTAAPEHIPLAERLRPAKLGDMIGQSHLLGPEGLLTRALAKGRLQSLILWGPPGVGKTTLARLLAAEIQADFMQLSAVMAGVKELRVMIDHARAIQSQGRQALLFIDEVHRFNKGQQDAFLPHVEAGLFVFVGATTENPSFELNKALLSRARVYVLQPLAVAELRLLWQRALAEDAILVAKGLQLEPEAAHLLEQASDGDGRRLLGLLELVADSAEPGARISPDFVQALLPKRLALFDKGGESFYELISALHKSVRGSNPDAALYWFCRMLEGGCDPLYIARRLVRMASEEIGNADPQALDLAMNAWQTQERLGSPEGELALAQTVLYLAAAPKSNAAYSAYKQMRKLVSQFPASPIPDHLCNAPTALLKGLGKGQAYRYAHDEPHAYAAGEHYLPEPVAKYIQQLPDARLYRPVDRGLELKIQAKLAFLRQLDEQAVKGDED